MSSIPNDKGGQGGAALHNLDWNKFYMLVEVEEYQHLCNSITSVETHWL